MEDALRSWDTDKLFGEIVRVIRINRPLVVVSRFYGGARDLHGHHQAMGVLTPMAVKAAGDPSRYSEHISEEGLRPWATPKLYRAKVREDDPWHVTLDTG